MTEPKHLVYLWALLMTLSVSIFQIGTGQRLNHLQELAHSTNSALFDLQKVIDDCPAGVELEIVEITTPDGRYTITVERPPEGRLEMKENKRPGERPGKPPGLFGPEPMILPGHGPDVLTTDGVF